MTIPLSLVVRCHHVCEAHFHFCNEDDVHAPGMHRRTTNLIVSRCPHWFCTAAFFVSVQLLHALNLFCCALWFWAVAGIDCLLTRCLLWFCAALCFDLCCCCVLWLRSSAVCCDSALLLALILFHCGVLWLCSPVACLYSLLLLFALILCRCVLSSFAAAVRCDFELLLFALMLCCCCLVWFFDAVCLFATAVSLDYAEMPC